MTPNPPIWVLNDTGEWTIFTTALVVFMVACGVVIVLSLLQVRREESDHRKALKSWGEVADKKGFEFHDLGVQDMFITGCDDGFKVRADVAEAPGGNILSDMPALSTRVVVRTEDAKAAKNIVLVSSLRRPDKDKESHRARRLDDYFQRVDDSAMELSEIVDPMLREILLHQADINDSVTISSGDVTLTRNKFIVDRTELTEMIDEALETARALNCPN